MVDDAVKLACHRVKKILPEFVYDTAALEGSPYTFIEIQTLLNGVTVGGHTLADQNLVLNQSASWKRLLNQVESGHFAVDMAIFLELHSLVAKGEALAWGAFRTRMVSIAGTDYRPPEADQLPQLFEMTRKEVNDIKDVEESSIRFFLRSAQNQFFFDGNKRTGRLMMNGLLLSQGHNAITVPAKRQQEFNEVMLQFYNTGQTENATSFMRSCQLP